MESISLRNNTMCHNNFPKLKRVVTVNLEEVDKGWSFPCVNPIG